MVCGNGTEMGNTEALKGRAKRKTITQKLSLSLIDVATKKENEERKQSLWNTFHCQSEIVSSNGKLYGKYCKNRICTVCCCIRKAEIINKYLHVIKTWDSPYFVTITVKSISAKRLKEVIDAMVRGFKRIKNKYRKRAQRGKGFKLMGIKSLECNFNPITKKYNPHFHIIVPNKATADVIVNEWLELWTSKWTIKYAQKISKISNLEKALIETVKYGSKIFTEPDLVKSSIAKDRSKIYVAALDNILLAMKHHRIFERFGFNLPTRRAKNSGTVAVLQNYIGWVFDPQYLIGLNREQMNG